MVNVKVVAVSVNRMAGVMAISLCPGDLQEEIQVFWGPGD